MDALAARLASTGACVERDVPLARRSSWRVGGPARLLVTCTTLAQLRAVLASTPVVPLGAGSNVLVHDAGVDGVVLVLGGELADLHVAGVRVLAGAGMRVAALLARLDRHRLAGAEGLAGVPGTVGGAVAMNAGTHLGAIGELVEAVDIVLPGGVAERRPAGALRFRYRHAALPPGAVVARVLLRLTDRDLPRRRALRRAHLERRRRTQPLDAPSCGSTFTNPPGDHAGRLIEAAGLKGRGFGGARVSPLHANFIVNEGGATAEDIRRTIVLVRREVLRRFGVLLEPEVRLLGPWPPDALEIPGPLATTEPP